MTVYEYIAIWLTILVTLFLLSITFYLNTRNKLAKFKLSITVPLDNTINSALDNLINNTFSEYLILNEGYKKKEYISAEDEKKMSDDLGSMVAHRLSESMYNKLSQYYSVDSIPEVISNKVYMTILDYSIGKNSLRNKEDNKK